MSFWRIWLARKGRLGPLISLLKNKDKGRRLKAAAILADLKNPKAAEPLISLLEDAFEDVRETAAKGLGLLADPVSIEPLKKRLKDEEPKVRRAAARSLVGFEPPTRYWGHIWLAAEGSQEQQHEGWVTLRKHGKEAFGPLTSALFEGPWKVQSTAAEVLGEIREIRAVEPLCAVLVDEDGDVRRAAAVALGKIRQPSAVAPLSETVRNTQEDVAVRKAAAESLSLFDAPDSFLGHTWNLAFAGEEQKKRAREILLSAKEAAFAPVRSALEEGYWTVRREAAAILAEMRDLRAVEPLIQALSTEDWQVRHAAASALGQLADRRAFDPLLRMLKDDQWKVRAAACFSLGQIGAREGADFLLRMLSDGKPEVRAMACRGLGLLKDPRAVKPVIDKLADESELVRAAAAESLGDLGSHTAIDPLCNILKDLHDEVRAAASLALGKLKSRRSFEPLLGALNDWYSQVCHAAALSLIEIGPPESMFGHAWLLGGGSDDERGRSAKIVQEAGRDAFEPLAACLKDWHTEVRVAAAKALGVLTDERAVGPLCSEVVRSPLDEKFIDAALRALATIKKPGTGVELAGKIAQAVFQAEDRARLKMLLSYTRQLAKSPWMNDQDRNEIVSVFKKILGE